ncbi:type VI secretion system baseplate subunit TssF [Acinetobacter populi]|uniref:Type VI secretion protein n=1 Tax=Acinetobacter populi TaxID=1582270 RepID=A0A1Z9Z409_9GAMM|nr:type VI secretion system baseplate subunit TssF [Acinetobacter populi]OUY09193.1 type VI secretion protein [Acinetobacter populi]
MDKDFLSKYHQELKFFRDASKEFAAEHPQAAKRLGLSAPEIEDPYVERLIEAVSFLTARINLKIDAEYPQFVQHILKVIHPEFTQPIPSAGIVALESSSQEAVFIPRLSQIVTHAKKQGQAMCQFSTCHDSQILPFTLTSLRYSRNSLEFAQNSIVSQTNYSKSILTFSLFIPANFKINNIISDSIRFFIKNNDLRASSELLYFLSQKIVKLYVELPGYSWKKEYSPKIVLAGFDDYLSVYNDRNINYLKHLLEYGVLPEKYLFFKIENLQEVFNDPFILRLLKEHNLSSSDKLDGNSSYELKFTFTFNDISNYLEKFLDEDTLCLNSIVINNAFQKTTRVLLDPHQNEQHIVIDKLRPNDFEVIHVDRVEGFSNANYKVKVFEPLYKLDNDTDHFDDNSYGFFSETHKPSNLNTKKNSYKGSECYLMLTNQLKHIIDEDLSQLSVNVWCSNRGLPSEISWSLDQDLRIVNDEFKINKIRRQCSFTQPLQMPMENASLWRLMNLISANFIPLQLNSNDALTEQIKNSLYIIYEITGSESLKAQINAILNISADKTSKVKRINYQLTPVNGLHFSIIIDEMLMSHVHPFLWGSVLMEYLKGFAPINHYIELSLQNKKKNVIAVYSTI